MMNFVIIIFGLLCLTVCQKVCNLRIADNKISVFKGSDIIFDNGKFNENRYAANALIPHISDISKDIEYFYAWEVHSGSLSHSPLKFNITSNDSSVVNPVFKITDDLSNEIYLTTMEIIYNCKDNQGYAQLRLNIISDLCDPIDIFWIKICGQKTLPKVNVGVTIKANEILENGILKDDLKYTNPNSENKLVIPKNVNSFSLYLQNVNSNSISLKEPVIVYDENLLNVIITGQLRKGGLIYNSTPQIVTFTFACTAFKQNINDFEISLQFDNNSMINLYFSKECDNVGEVQQYFNIFYTLYYILLMIFFGFIMTLIYYYFKSNNLTIADLFKEAKNYINIGYTIIIKKLNKFKNKEDAKDSETTECLYEERDLVDVNIRTERRIQTKYSSDYGGI